MEPVADVAAIGQTVADNPKSVRGPAVSAFLGPLLNGLAWTAAAKWSTQLLSWTSTVVVVRLLSPADFGIVGMATVYFGLVTILSECGLGSAVVYKRTLTDTQIDQLNSLSLLLGFAAFGLSCALSVPLASFFRTPELALVILLMSTTFIVSALQVVPYALLQREGAFKQLALADAVRTMFQVAITVSLAAFGWRYWSLVVGNIVGTTMAAAVLLRWRHRPFMRPRRAALQPAITFSRDVLVSRLSWYAYANSDFVVAGRVLGQVELGAYAVAWNLASTSIDKLTDLLARVGPTFVSEAQHDTASLRRYVRHLTRGISLITFPVTLGLAAVAPDFVLVVLGSRWATAVAPLQLLALYGCLRSITTLFGPIMSAVDVRWASRYSLVFPLVFPTAFYVGSRWGTVGIAAGWVCLYPLLYIPIYRRLLRRLEMPLREYLRTLWPALSGSVAMLVVVGAIRQFAPSDWPRAESLAVEVCAGAMTYLGAVAVAHRDDYAIVRQLVRSVRS